MNKFKDGCKVKIPKTKSRGCGFRSTNFQYHLLNSKVDYCTYLEDGPTLVIHTKTRDQRWDISENDLELYEEEFIIPEKWYVVPNKENVEIISKYRSDGKLNISLLCGEHAIMYPNFMNTDKLGYCLHTDNITDETEISFDQFRKYILKEDINIKESELDKLIKESRELYNL